MLLLLKNIKESILHLVFPHICEGCGSDLLQPDHYLCLKCLSKLPHTRFHLYADNPVEQHFWGRIPVTHATAQYYFTKESLVQAVMHGIKYRGHKELGIYMGRLMGSSLSEASRFGDVEALIPLPLHPRKERRRGFNQATLLCRGISEVTGWPVVENVVIRSSFSESQTRKGRVERWQNMQGRFELVDDSAVKGRHVLLVDDVITTGATLEACGAALLKAEGLRLSIATLLLCREVGGKASE
jgi:ComF family protein